MRNLVLLLALTVPLACTKVYFTKPADAYQRIQIVWDLKLNDNIFRLQRTVTIPGDTQDISELVDQFGLLESARKARANGFAFFTVAQHQSRHFKSGCSSGESYLPCSTNFDVLDTILCFKEAPNVQSTVYDADKIIDSMTSRYGLTGARAAR